MLQDLSLFHTFTEPTQYPPPTHPPRPPCFYRGVGEVLLIAYPAKQRVIERVPQQEQRLSDPERGLVDAVDADERLDVV